MEVTKDEKLHNTDGCSKKNIITPEMEKVAAKERMTPEEIRALVAEGKVAICANKIINA